MYEEERKRVERIVGNGFKTKEYVKRGVFRGILKGNEVFCKNDVEECYLKYHKLWEKTTHLPKLLFVSKKTKYDDYIIVMEKLEPFVYNETMLKSYYDALNEILSFLPNDYDKKMNLDISPTNTMMRADGTIVFIDLWTAGITPFYFTSMGNPPVESLIRVLFNYKHIDFIRKWIKEMALFFRANFKDSVTFYQQTEQNENLYKCSDDAIEKECCLASCFNFYRAFSVVDRLKTYLSDKGKSIDDMTWDIHGFHDKDYGDFFNQVKYNPVTTSDFMKAFQIKANCESDSILIQFQ